MLRQHNTPLAAALLLVLLLACRADVARAVVALRYSGWLSNESLPARYDEWRDSQIFVVVAGLLSRYNGHAARVADTKPTTPGVPKC